MVAIKIKRYKDLATNRYCLVADWKWRGLDVQDLCIICQSEFEASCPYCQKPGISCSPGICLLWANNTLVVGKCGHALHAHCVQKMALSERKADKMACPMCRSLFVCDSNLLKETA